MTKVVSILSGKGGVGKTTVCINLGTALSFFGRNVIAMDSNFASPHLGLHLGANSVPVTLQNVMKGVNHVSEATYLHPCGLKIIPSSLSYEEYKALDISAINNVISDLEGYSEVLFIDTPSGIGKDTKHILNSSDYVIIVTTPDMPSITDALKSAKLAQEHNVNILGIIINKVRGDDFEISGEDAQAFLEIPLLGSIPYDSGFRHSISLKNPFVNSYPESNASQEFKRIASHLIGHKQYEKKEEKSLLKGISESIESIGLRMKFIPSTKFKKKR